MSDPGAGEDADATEEGSVDEMDADEMVDALFDRFREGAEALAEAAGEGGSFEDVQELVDDIVDVAEEAEELLATVDLDDVPEAVDLDGVDDAVEAEDVPEAVAERDPGEVVNLAALHKLVELGKLWDEVDVREAWRNAEELDDEVDDVLSLEAIDENQEVDDEDREKGDVTDHGLSGEVPSEALATTLGSEIRDAAEEFREALLDTHDRLAELRAENEERTESAGQPASRNPSAFSTMAMVGRDRPTGARGSTVPRETRYSRTPNFRRIYGHRFEEERDD